MLDLPFFFRSSAVFLRSSSSNCSVASLFPVKLRDSALKDCPSPKETAKTNLLKLETKTLPLFEFSYLLHWDRQMAQDQDL